MVHSQSGDFGRGAAETMAMPCRRCYIPSCSYYYWLLYPAIYVYPVKYAPLLLLHCLPSYHTLLPYLYIPCHTAVAICPLANIGYNTMLLYLYIPCNMVLYAFLLPYNATISTYIQVVIWLAGGCHSLRRITPPLTGGRKPSEKFLDREILGDEYIILHIEGLK